VIGSITNAVNSQAKQITEISNKINSLIMEISSIKEEIKKLKDSPVTPPLKQKDVREGQTQFKQEVPTPPSPPQAQQSMSGHVRSGNYKPDDVSIEKFFYFGNR
jgi:septum formation inhibitor MinC